MIVFGAALAGLLMLADHGGKSISSGHSIGPKYHRYDFEAACQNVVFRVRYRNGPMGRSGVDDVRIDGRPIPNAARTLNLFAGRRTIGRIGIMHCGMDPGKPFFRGAMELAKPESQPFNRENTLYFRLVRQDEDWRLIVD